MQPENREPTLEAEVIYAELDTFSEQESKPPRRSFVEQLLSPQSLQWMMGCGGVILILGFVIWLWSVGIFENPVVVATSVGGATLAIIATGVSMVRLTRYQLAGRWLTLLGAFALPLNLWLYDAQGLVTLSNGGHLWIPAAVCCFIYAAIAKAIKDATFVYTFVGGIVMTGMLFLADESIGRFWELMPTVTFLLSIGWVSVFVERLFVDNEGDFSRKKFGLAFQRSGILAVASGLAILLGSQAFSVVNELMLNQFLPTTTMSPGQKAWAIGAIVTSAVGFAMQGLLLKYRNYHLVAAFLLAWTVPLTLNFFAIQISVASIAILLAAMVLLANVYVALFISREGESDTNGTNTLVSSIEFGSQVVTSILAVAAILQVVFYMLEINAFPIGTIGWVTALQYGMTAFAAFAVGWNSLFDHAKDNGSTSSMFAVGTVLVLFAAWNLGILAGVGTASWFCLALGLVPLVAAVIGIRTNHAQGRVAAKLSASTSVSTLLCLLATTASLSAMGWSVCFAIASATYMLASSKKAVGVNRVLGFISATASISLLGHSFGFDFGYCLIIAPMLLGTGMRVVDSMWLDGDVADGEIQATPLATLANLLVLGSGAASVLLSLSRWLESNTGGSLILVVTTTLACTTLVSFLTKDSYWRTVFRALIVAMVGSFICVFDGFLNMDGWHRAEVCSLLGGSLLLVLGHVAWSREAEGKLDETASLSLMAGSVLIVVPLLAGLMFHRLDPTANGGWRLFHEVGAISAGLLLFGSGILCRLRSTTLAGGCLLVLFVVSLATLIQLPEQLQNVSIMMMVGGGIFFGTALLMSIYRDRLVSLPKRIREGEGVYRVLKWR